MAKKTKKKDILTAAQELFAERGYQATSTAEIARRAEVAEGLIFHYFKHKSGLLLEIFDSMFKELNAVAETAAAAEETGLEALRAFVRSHFQMLKRRRTEMCVSVRDLPAVHGEMEAEIHGIVKKRAGQRIQILVKCLERGMKDGTIRQVSPRETALIIGGMLFGLTHFILRSPMKMPDMEDEAISFIDRSVAAAD